MNIEKANLDLHLDIINGVITLKLESDCLSSFNFDENLHLLLSSSSKRTKRYWEMKKRKGKKRTIQACEEKLLKKVKGCRNNMRGWSIKRFKFEGGNMLGWENLCEGS